MFFSYVPYRGRVAVNNYTVSYKNLTSAMHQMLSPFRIQRVQGPQPQQETGSENSSFLTHFNDFETEAIEHMIPEEHRNICLQASKSFRRLLSLKKVPIMIKSREGVDVQVLIAGMDQLLTNSFIIQKVRVQSKIDTKNLKLLCAKLERCPSLTQLELRYSDMDNEGVAILAQMLPQFTSLNHLDLRRGSFEKKGTDALSAVLPKCTSLMNLGLSWNYIDVEEIAAVLPQCTSLTILDLSYNNIGVEEMPSVASVLPQCTSLTLLDLRGNEFEDEGMYSLVNVLPQCPSFKYLRLSDNGICGEMDPLFAAKPDLCIFK